MADGSLPYAVNSQNASMAAGVGSGIPTKSPITISQHTAGSVETISNSQRTHHNKVISEARYVRCIR